MERFLIVILSRECQVKNPHEVACNKRRGCRSSGEILQCPRSADSTLVFIIPTASFINKPPYEAIYNRPQTKKLLRKLWNDRKTPSVLLFGALCKHMTSYSFHETRNPEERSPVMSQKPKRKSCSGFLPVAPPSAPRFAPLILENLLEKDDEQIFTHRTDEFVP